MSWMIYGANGYTRALTAREALARGLKPVRVMFRCVIIDLQYDDQHQFWEDLRKVL